VVLYFQEITYLCYFDVEVRSLQPKILQFFFSTNNVSVQMIRDLNSLNMWSEFDFRLMCMEKNPVKRLIHLVYLTCSSTMVNHFKPAVKIL